ncbi:hypothetical protein ABT224_41500 [Streptomyces sp. NPDC001584]|uniref:hypothetical protein n=1 Tax=Streptomyces sp. NPDC001584 TaxID=3154521 RepID=UPI0033202879
MTQKRPAHRSIPHTECGTCAKILSILLGQQRKELGQPLTGAAIAAAAGLQRRATLVHVAHLVECEALEPDGRTPRLVDTPDVPGAIQTPLDWAANLALSCRACGRLLAILAAMAGPDWSARATVADLAQGIGLSDRPTRTHLDALTGVRPHARHMLPGPLLRSEVIPGTRKAGGLRYVLLTGLITPGSGIEFYTPQEYGEQRERGYAILAQVPIAGRMPAHEKKRAVEKLIIPRLNLNYPDGVILEALASGGDSTETAHNPYGLIQYRLKTRAPLIGYVPTAKTAYDPTPRMHDCIDCERPWKAPMHVQRCPNCELRHRAGITIEVAEQWEIAGL